MVNVFGPKTLRKMTDQELQDRLHKINLTQIQLRIAREKGLFNPGEWRKIRKEKARILTIIRERELGINC